MPTVILNLAAGLLPLVPADFGSPVGRVVNFDPLRAGNAEEAMLYARFLELTAPHTDITYCRSSADVDRILRNESVDLLLGISPYGFPLVSTWSSAKLRRRIGYVACLSNSSNKYGDTPDMFEGQLGAIYAKTVQAPGWILHVIQKVAENYSSHVTALKRSAETILNRHVIYCKSPRG